MDSASAWEAQTKELIARVDLEIQEIQAEAARRIAVYNRKKEALEESLATYREMMYIEDRPAAEILTPDDVREKSQKDILCLIASRNNGLLVANQAVKLMKDAGVFGNPENASSAIYSVLKRSTKEFVRVGQGVYKLRDWSQTADAAAAKDNRKIVLPPAPAGSANTIASASGTGFEPPEEEPDEANDEADLDAAEDEETGNDDRTGNLTNSETIVKPIDMTTNGQPETPDDTENVLAPETSPAGATETGLSDADAMVVPDTPAAETAKQAAGGNASRNAESWIQQLEPEAIKLIPLVLARKYNAVPISVTGNTLIVAMSNPYDIFAIEAFSAKSRKHITPVAANSEEIKQAIDYNYRG